MATDRPIIRVGVTTARSAAAAAVVLATVLCAAARAGAGSAAAAPEALAPQVLSQHWGGAATSAVLVGATAYVGIGPRLAVVDVTTPAAPRVLGISDPSAVVLAETAAGPGRVYAVDDKVGLLIFDVTDPARPRQVGLYKGRGDMGGVAVIGGAGDGARVLITDDEEGVVALDVANAAKAVVLGRFEVPGDGAAQEVAAADGRAFVTIRGDQNQLIALDVTNPARMIALGQVLPPSAFMSALAVDGPRVFIADGQGLTAVDAADPGAMRVTGQFEEGAMDRVAVNGSTVWCANTDGAWVVDAREPAKMRAVTALRSDDGVNGVASAGALAVVADNEALQVLDVGEPLAESSRARIDLSDVKDLDLSDIARVGNLLVVAGGGAGVRVLDVGNPAQPRSVGKIAGYPGGHHRTFSAGVTVVGSVAFVAEDGLGGGLRTIDITDPSKPRELGAVDAAGQGRRPVVMGDTVLVPSTGADAMGVRLFSAADTARLRELAFVPQDGPVAAVAVAGGKAFAAGAGLAVIDLADPALPAVLGTLPALDLSGGVASDGRWVYAGSPTEGLVVIDAGDPARPRVAARLDVSGGALDVLLDGQTLYVAAGTGGVLKVDVKDPARPVLAARWVAAEAALGLALGTDGLWVRGGLDVVRAIAPGAPSAPRVVGALAQSGAVLEVGADGGRVAALSGWSTDHRHLAILDVASTPRLLGKTALGKLSWALAPGEDLTFLGGRAWVPGGPGLLTAFDARDPAAIVRMSAISDTEEAVLEHAVVVGDRGYGIHRDALFVVDVRDPASPVVAGREPLSNAFALAASADTAWVLSGDTDATVLTAYDVRSPRAIVEGGHWTVPGGAADLVLDGGRLYLATTGVGLSIWRATGPRDAGPLGSLTFKDWPKAVAVAGNRAWVALTTPPGFTVHAVDVSDPAAPVDLGAVRVPDRQDIDLAAYGQSVAVGNAAAGLYVLTYGEAAVPPTATPTATETGVTTPTAESPRAHTPTPGGPRAVAYLPVGVRAFPVR